MLKILSSILFSHSFIISQIQTDCLLQYLTALLEFNLNLLINKVFLLTVTCMQNAKMYIIVICV